jgi:hypothetical protein
LRQPGLEGAVVASLRGGQSSLALNVLISVHAAYQTRIILPASPAQSGTNCSIP